jgi:uncharacterized protein (DUF1778 family)
LPRCELHDSHEPREIEQPQPAEVLLDQTTIYADAKAVRQILDWMGKPATAEETSGMKKLLAARTVWPSKEGPVVS